MSGFSRSFELHAGPIGLRIECDGDAEELSRAEARARKAFPPILPSLADELETLRRKIEIDKPPPTLSGRVARRMYEAALPFADEFVTPMAAVAGAVADYMLEQIARNTRLRRAFVNNGGDIAIHLNPGTSMRLALVGNIAAPAVDGLIRIDAGSHVRGVATSGWRGRSFSFGIADSVTVLARTAATADVAATLVANAVNIDDPAIVRRPARDLLPDSDLGDMAVTVGVPPLSRAKIEAALDRGEVRAKHLVDEGRIEAAALFLGRETRLVDPRGMLAAG
ncbi:MAG: UPF0280 family protein [Geminicoccaceae bacterium]